MIRRRPKQFFHHMFAGIVLEQSTGLSDVMICGYRVRLRACTALQKQTLECAALVVPRIAQRPTLSVDIGVGIGTSIKQHARNFELIA